MANETLTENARAERFKNLRGRYTAAVPKVKGGVSGILLRETVIEGWLWILFRLGLDINELPEEKRLVQDLSDESTVIQLIERAGAQAALPEAFLEQVWQPLPEVEFWTSHVTGEPLPNPWATENKQDQLWVTQNLGKEFAAELEIAARGGRSYAEEFNRREQERLGDLVKNWDLDSPNPFEERPQGYDAESIEWARWASTERRRIEKENPVLAAWLKRIAQPLHVNPWTGDGWNMTRQMAVTKADPQWAQVLERVGQWQKLQLDDEATAARRALAAAQEAAARAETKARLEQRRRR